MKLSKNKSLYFAIAMIGFTATSGQILLVREFIVIFYGNELSLGVILANWLLWGAIGSWALGYLADKIKRRIGILAFSEILLAIMLPALIFAIRTARVLLKAQPGELIGFLPIVAFSFIVLAPFCSILGFLFSLASRMFPSSKGAKQIGYTYILEGIGASAGGLLTSLMLIRYLNSFQIAMIIGSLNLLSATSLRLFLGKRKSIKVFFRGIIALLLLINLYLLIPNQSILLDSIKANSLESKSLSLRWGMLELKESKNSIYGNLAVLGSDETFSFFSNGLSMFSVPNPSSAEQTAHFAMLEHPDPKKVLLIGGGVSGSLAEILKYPVTKVDYVELDPLVIELAEKWLPKEHLKPLSDPRTTIVNIDGRLFIKRTKEKYDIIIIDLPEPYTAQLNRFYTIEFFKEVYDKLADNGIFFIGVISSANYLSDDHQKFLHCIYKTLDSVFPDIITIPTDDQMLFISCKSNGILTYDQQMLSNRLIERNIETLYIDAYQMPIWLEPWRVKSFAERIREPLDVKINRDFQPVSYYYDMVLWSAQFSGSKIQSKYKDIFRWISNINLLWFLMPIVIICTALFLIGNWKSSIRRDYVLLAIMLTGFAEISFEVIVSLGFQILYGYMYYKIGLILTAFMIGLIIGSIIMTKIMDRLKNDLSIFLYTQIMVCIYPLILLLAFYLFRGEKAYFLGSNIIFPFLPVIAGFIGGFQFPLATKIYLKYKTRVGQVAGMAYGVDLIGSCAGAFLVSAFLVPIIGIPNTCYAISIIGFLVLILLMQSYYRH
jgi:spermidine synthase